MVIERTRAGGGVCVCGVMIVLIFNYSQCPSLEFHSFGAVDIWGQVNL